MHPLNFIPKLGETKPVPGGMIVCTVWKAQYGRQYVEGEITFRFIVDKQVYEKAEAERAANAIQVAPISLSLP